MRSYALSQFQQSEPKLLEMFYRIRSRVASLPDDLDEGKLGMSDDGSPVILSCHILARAAAKAFAHEAIGLTCQDGLFKFFFVSRDQVKPDFTQHSWLVTSRGHIIDVYPIAMVSDGPVLIDGHMGSPWSNLYVVKDISLGRFELESFLQAVETVADLLR